MDIDPTPDAALWTVYMLVNDQGHTYVGITTDVSRRVRQHNGAVLGGARATRGRGTWQVVYVEEGFAGRAAAQSREYYLKRDRALRRRLAKAAEGELAPPLNSVTSAKF